MFDDYPNTRRILYDDMCFLPICPVCSLFVKADKVLTYEENGNGDVRFPNNATCSRHGRVIMPFEGHV